jgi:hypothetical protein
MPSQQAIAGQRTQDVEVNLVVHVFRNAWHCGESGQAIEARSKGHQTGCRRERGVRAHVLRWHRSRAAFPLGGFVGERPGVEIIGLASDIK